MQALGEPGNAGHTLHDGADRLAAAARHFLADPVLDHLAQPGLGDLAEVDGLVAVSEDGNVPGVLVPFGLGIGGGQTGGLDDGGPQCVDAPDRDDQVLKGAGLLSTGVGAEQPQTEHLGDVPGSVASLSFDTPMITKPMAALLCTPTGHVRTSHTTPELDQALPVTHVPTQVDGRVAPGS